jgi:NAD(P)-dependent dehydrogenase (short-subunit alcohol dehydrogenase family)
MKRGHGRLRVYDQSKLALILFSNELAPRLQVESICASSVEPGSVKTAQTRLLGSVARRARRLHGRAKNSGGGGIRTHEALARPTVFKTAPFDRSGTPPGRA